MDSLTLNLKVVCAVCLEPLGFDMPDCAFEKYLSGKASQQTDEDPWPVPFSNDFGGTLYIEPCKHGCKWGDPVKMT